MPCYDGREAQWAADASRRLDAMTAVLCGVMNTDKRALEFAVEWCRHHTLVDQYRQQVKYDFEDRRIERELALCDSVMDRAHAVLCVRAATIRPSESPS